MTKKSILYILGFFVLVSLFWFYNQNQYQKITINNKSSVVNNSNSQAKNKVSDIEERMDFLEDNYKNNQYIPTLSQFYGDNMGSNINYKFLNSINDCVGLENGYTNGGDLLATLINNNEARVEAKLNIYTKDYLSKIKLSIDNYVQKNYNKDLFSFYVCNVAKDIDIISGYVWSKEKIPYIIENDNIKIVDQFFDKEIVLLSNTGSIKELSVPALNSTATGGEVDPCRHILTNQNIEWQCFAGLQMNDDNTTYGLYDNWLISLDGKILKKWQTK